LIKDVSRKSRKHQKAAAKQARIGVGTPSASNPSPEDGNNIASDGSGEVLGANENVEEF